MKSKLFIQFITILMLFLFISGLSVSAFEPYANYTYSSNGQAFLEPQAYIPAQILDAASLGIDSLSNPSDIFCDNDGNIFLVDTGNDRIVLLDSNYQLLDIIDSFDNSGVVENFNRPQGIFLSEENHLYIADTENKRIVRLDENFDLFAVYNDPLFDQEHSGDVEYRPISISVDRAGRMFIVSRNVNKGMIELDNQGNFVSYFGAIRVLPSVGSLIWRRILTQQQIDTGELLLPTEYSNNTVDREGFVYGTVSAIGVRGIDGSRFIRKLNPTGLDILRRTSFWDPMGDIDLAFSDQGDILTSRFIDITVNETGVYSVLDSRRGRIFTYDYDGNLMYVFGSIGETMGAFSLPRALESDKKGNFLVADGTYNHIVVFSPTKYANLINKAVQNQYERNYTEAAKNWEEVLNYTTNSEVAYIGIGKAYYRQSQFAEAMHYFKLGNERNLYSRSFNRYRREVMEDIFGIIMTVIIVVVVGLITLKITRRFITKRKKYERKYKQNSYREVQFY